jgi:signal peptide peptidase SppA
MRLDERSILAIDPAALAGIRARLALGERAETTTAEAAPRGVVAVIPIRGPIQHRPDVWMSFLGGTSSVGITAAVRAAAADDTVRTIVLDVDSPGGEVYGVTEAAAAVFEARSRKRVVAIANGLMASAAYWIASQAEEIIITPSGEAGSIGVIAMHADLSKQLEADGVTVSIIHAGEHKADGSPYVPLSDSAKAALQADVDAYYDLFVRDVARGRGVKPADVRAGFGRGRVLTASAAKAEGLVDRIESLDALLARLTAPKRNNARRADVERRRLALHRLG